jgi:CheY-like chemotaxis protein
LDKGSTFTVRLPAIVGELKSEPAEPMPPIALRPEDGDTVLIIDDDPANLDLMSRFLAKEGFRTVTASRGLEGLRLARELRPAAVILDVLIPEMDGWSVLTAIKSDPDLADIPVIMVSMVDNRSMGLALGAADFLAKPIDPTSLGSLLGKYCGDAPPGIALIVEDDPPAREVLRRLLQKAGWQVIEAENGRIGLERLAETQPQLILLDLMMPGIDGFEFAVELRKNAAWRSIPVIVISAKELTDEDRRRLKGNVQRILEKCTYSRDTLLREIRDLMVRRPPSNGLLPNSVPSDNRAAQLS